MEKCIKTGAIIYAEATNQYVHVDLFYNGSELSSNRNKMIDGKPPIMDVIVTEINDTGKHFELVNPQTTQRLHDYVNSPYKGYIEEKFLKDFIPV